MGEPIVRLSDLTVAYGPRIALERATLDIRRGEFLGVIGPNGSGKSTLLKTILGLLAPLRGRLEVLGQVGAGVRRVRHRIGYLPQRGSMNLRFPVSVREVVLMGRYSSLGIGRRPGPEDHRLALAALEQVDMADLADRPVGELSGGQQQRAFIARALVQGPELLLLDEPTTAVDVATQRSIVETLSRLHAEGLTIVMVTHDVNPIMPLIDRVLYLNRRIYACGPPEEVVEERMLSELYGTDVVVVPGHDRPRVLVADHHA